MKKPYIILSGLGLSALLVFLLIQRNHQVGGSRPDQSSSQNTKSSATGGTAGNSPSSGSSTNGTTSSTAVINNSNGTAQNSAETAQKATPAPKENDCFRFAYQHQSKNQNRDIEDFLNDTNAFPIAHGNVNQKSVCVKVNDKPVNHKLVKKDGKTEVIIGSVVGPESTIQVSYCVGKAPCKEACAVKTKNKVDELLSDSEMGGLENAELETQVKELRNVASVHGDLMDSTVIRDWNKLQSKEWVCEK